MLTSDRGAELGCSGCNKLPDGALEPFLDLDQRVPIRRSANRTECGEGGVCHHHHPRIPRNQLHAEPGSFRASTQPIAFNASRLPGRSGRVIAMEPQTDESSLELGQRSSVGATSGQLLLTKPLVARERFSAFGRATLKESRATLKEIGAERPRQGCCDADNVVSAAFTSSSSPRRTADDRASIALTAAPPL